MAVAAPTSGLVGRFRADSLASVADGGSVTSWADSVGARTLVTRNAPPTKVAAGAGGQPAVRFNGTSQALEMSSPPTVAQPFTRVVVLKMATATGSTDRQVIFQGSGGELLATAAGQWLDYGGAPRTASSPVVTTNPTVVTSAFQGDAATSEMYVNGALAIRANVGTGSMDQGLLILGNNPANARWLNADVYEVLIYNRILTSTERQQLHSYVQDRYAITVSDYSAGADTTAPTVPGSLAAVANSATSIGLSWAASTDASGSVTYRILRNGVALTGATALTGTSFTDTTATASTAYAYTVSAVDASGNRSGESNTATVTTPASGLQRFRSTGSAAVLQKVSRWTGSALVDQLFDKYASGGTTPVVGTSVAARKQLYFGAAPEVRVLYSSGVDPATGSAQVAWVGSFPDVRARTSRLETGVAAQAQDAWQAYIQDLTTSTTVVDSGITTGTAERWTAPGFTPVAGRRYKAFARVRAADGQWSGYASTRFVAPTGVVRLIEDYGTVDRTGATACTDVVRAAMKACNPGDTVKVKNPGTTLFSIAASGSTLSSSVVPFTSAMVGKKVMVHRAGTTDTTTNSWVHRTTISAVASDGKSATLTAAVSTNVADTKVVVDYAELLVGHLDCDNGLSTPGNGGGWTLDGTGALFTSTGTNWQASSVSGIRVTLPDVSFVNVHYWQKVAATRGGGRAGATVPFFVDGDPVNNPMGIRIIGCYAERAIDAGILVYGPKSVDVHVVDCVADHTNADGFHVTGAANNVQFIRTDNIYIGDDAVANIGYRSDGDGSRPFNIVWERPRVYGQDWGRGVSQGGCFNVLVTDLYIERGAGASFILGSDGDMANTAQVQIRRVTIVQPNLRRGLAPVYSQGSSTSSRIPDEPWLKLLNNNSATAQRDILLEDVVVTDGRYLQIISYGGGTFVDNTITLRNIVMNGTVNGGTNWRDEGTYPQHIDLRGISVPSGSTPITAAPSSPNSSG